MAVPEISVRDVQQLLDSPTPPRLIDVRERDEWEICRIPGAELLPLSAWPALVTEKLSDPHASIVLYCHHGGRSERAAQFLLGRGFTSVKNLTGGVDAWAVEIDPGVARY
jgi:rhodanese-related sulfurtransferase